MMETGLWGAFRQHIFPLIPAPFPRTVHLTSMIFDQPNILLWLGRIWPVVLGGASGYAYYRFVGCRTGTCPITSNPWISTIYGAVLGAMLSS